MSEKADAYVVDEGVFRVRPFNDGMIWRPIHTRRCFICDTFENPAAELNPELAIYVDYLCDKCKTTLFKLIERENENEQAD